VRDSVWEDVARLLDKNEIVRLLIAICAINVWNRMAVSTHQAPPERDEAAKDAVANPTLPQVRTLIARLQSIDE